MAKILWPVLVRLFLKPVHIPASSFLSSPIPTHPYEKIVVILLLY